MFASTDAGPVLDWFAQSTADNRRTRNIYLVVLRQDLPSPLAKESDEEKPRPADAAAEKPAGAAAGDQSAAKKPVEPVRIDFDGIEYRILDLPVPAGELSNLQAGDAGQIYYQRATDAPGAEDRAAPLRSDEAQGRADPRKRPELRHLRRRQEAALRLARQLGDRIDRAEDNAG